jgi:hypothetical protein
VTKVESMEDRADRLAGIAVELRDRVQGGEIPEDTALWLLAVCPDPREQFDLHFIQAAATAKDWERATAWARRTPEPIIDEVAVARACHGERIKLTRLERQAAVERLTLRGASLNEISRKLHMSGRSVQRAQKALRDSA